MDDWNLLIVHQRSSESSELSGVNTRFLYGLADRVLPQVEMDTRTLSFIVRKAAYFTAYLFFGILVMNGLKRQGAAGVQVAEADAFCVRILCHLR